MWTPGSLVSRHVQDRHAISMCRMVAAGYLSMATATWHHGTHNSYWTVRWENEKWTQWDGLDDRDINRLTYEFVDISWEFSKGFSDADL
jgi:hypothetical protein